MVKIEKSAKHAVFASNWLFWWKNKILNVSEEFEGYFQHLKKSTKKINQQNCHAVRSGYSDFGQNWKVRKTCCFCFKLIVLMKEQNFECFRRIRRVFSTFEKLNQKNQLKNGHAGKVRIQRFWSKLKSPQNMLFLLQTDCFDERTKFWMFQKNSKGIFNISKNQPKKSTNKIATPVRSGYSDFGQNWKVRKTCCFCFKLIVLMKEQNFECFRRIRRVFSTFEKLNQKNQLKNGHAGKVRIQRFWSKLKSPQNMLFLPQTDCFDERTKFWMFQKNSKGIFNIWKTQPKKSTNKIATPVRSGYSDFGQNWNVRKTCCFCLKLIVLKQHVLQTFQFWPKSLYPHLTSVAIFFVDFLKCWKYPSNSSETFKILFFHQNNQFEAKTACFADFSILTKIAVSGPYRRGHFVGWFFWLIFWNVENTLRILLKHSKCCSFIKTISLKQKQHVLLTFQFWPKSLYPDLTGMAIL